MPHPELAGKSLLDLVFSWSLDNIFNEDLYKYKVKSIPKTFDSVAHYLDSFIYPLIEETREELFSSMATVSVAPTFRISCMEIPEDQKPPDDFLCIIGVEQIRCLEDDVEPYEPETGDLIAITDVKPKCAADLSSRKLLYVLAVVQRVNKEQNENEYTCKVRLSKPIAPEIYALVNGDGETAFAVVLSNITTNDRIWKALNSELGEGSFNIISNVLQMETPVYKDCSICFHSERNLIEASAAGALIRSLNLNQSQEEAVLSCVALKDCYHKNTVKLIWGPPGTGKTKSTSSFLFAMLKMKCKVVTCAPTNVAVVEITKRLLKLASKSLDYRTYGLGDIILYGNGKRMKIDDHADLFDVFLDFRAHMLSKCLQPSSGWKSCLNSMICFLENPQQQYHLFLLNENIEDNDNVDKDDQLLEEVLDTSDSRWKKIIVETLRARKSKKNSVKVVKHPPKASAINRDGRNDGPSNMMLTFEEFVKKQFHSLRNKMKFYSTILYTHLPTSFISLKVVRSMIQSLNMLDNLLPFIGCANFSDCGSDKLTSDCLIALKSLRDRFDVPNLHGQYEIRKFCLLNGCLFFCTASSSIKLYEDGPKRLQIAVIDEAAQLKECESAIPLLLPGLRHAVIIGDERQLPAMVKSKVSEKAHFGRSLFERLVLLEYERHLLNVQYRMQPLISLFPNMEFYQKKLLDAPSVKEESYKRHVLPGSMYGTYSFIDVRFGKEMANNGHSLMNVAEVAVVCEIVWRLFREFSDTRRPLTVGIISPYKAQVNAIEQNLAEMKIMEKNDRIFVRVRSVDGFQGGEEDVIIISTVRCNGNGAVGFLSDRRRSNVALTRARYCLWIIGSGATLINSDSVWKKLVVDAKARDCFFNAEEDENLAPALALSLLELDELNIERLNLLLFRKSKWKVLFGDNFWQSVISIEKMAVRKKVLSLLLSLSSGWRKSDGERYVNFKGEIPNLFEYIKVDGVLHLVWNVDIVELNSNYVQILKFWEVLPCLEIPRLLRNLKTFFSTYTEGRLLCCKVRSSEGNLEVPMTWPADAYARGNYVCLSAFMEILTNKFASLTLKD